MPQGTRTLECETCADGARVGTSGGGLFAGALSGTAGWRLADGTIEKTGKGILLKGTKDIIVRVCGFSARFVSLSKRWQDEVIARHRLR